MSKMNKPSIDALVADLQPRSALNNKTLWVEMGVALLLGAAIVVTFFGVRPDYVNAFSYGTWLWKPAIFILAGLGGLAVIAKLSRPHTHTSGTNYVPFGVAAALIAWQCLIQFSNQSWFGAVSMLKHVSAYTCTTSILIGGTAIFAVMWGTWLRKTAPTKPTLMGAVAGFSAGNLAASAYVIYCGKDMMLYIFAYYGTSIALLTVAGALLGRRYLKW